MRTWHLTGDRAGMALAFGAAVLFGTAYVGTALAIRSFTPLGVALWRGLLATVVLVPLVGLMSGWSGWRAMSAARLWRLVILGFTGGLGFVVCMNSAVSLAGATLAAFAASLSPVLAAILAPLVLGEALTLAAGSAFALAVVGTALLSGTDPLDVGPGVLAGLGASLCFALFLLLSRRWSTPFRLSGAAIALSIAATTGIGLLPVELIAEPASLLPGDVRPEALLGLGWLVLGPGVIAQLLIVGGVRRVETRFSAAMLLVSPVTAAIFATWLLGERMTGVEVAGAMLVLSGVVVSALFRGSSRDAPRRETAVAPREP